MIHTDQEGYALPGDWYRRYLASWRIAFPGKTLHEPGRFYREARWASSTPAWDTWWFESFGVKPPKYRFHLQTRVPR